MTSIKLDSFSDTKANFVIVINGSGVVPAFVWHPFTLRFPLVSNSRNTVDATVTVRQCLPMLGIGSLSVGDEWVNTGQQKASFGKVQ